MKLTKILSLVILSLICTGQAFAQTGYTNQQEMKDLKPEKKQAEVSLVAKLNKAGTAYEMTIDSVHVCDLIISKITSGRQIFKCDSNYQLVAFKALNWMGATYYSVFVQQNGSQDVLAQIDIQLPRELTPYEKLEMNPYHLPPGKI